MGEFQIQLVSASKGICANPNGCEQGLLATRKLSNKGTDARHLSRGVESGSLETTLDESLDMSSNRLHGS